MRKKGYITVDSKPDIHADTVIVDDVLALLNELRASNGQPPLKRGDIRPCILALVSEHQAAAKATADLQQRLVIILAAAGGFKIS